MKRLICILLVAAMIGLAAACAGSDTSSGGGGGGSNASSAPGGSGDGGNSGGGDAATPAPTDSGSSAATPTPTSSGGNSATPAPTDGGDEAATEEPTADVSAEPSAPPDSGNGGDGDNGDGGDGGDSGGDGGSGLSGSAAEVLANIDAALRGAGVEIPMALPPMDVAPDLSQNTIGLSESDFGRLVVSAANSMAAIATHAHQLVIIQAVDEKAATEIKNLVSGAGGYDAKKWICVFPEKASAVESGCYVLLAASYADAVDAAIATFSYMAGGIGGVVTFWEFAGDAYVELGEGVGGGGLAPLPIG